MSGEIDILQVRSSAGLYGAEYVLLGLIPALTKLGIASRLLCLDNPYLGQQPLYVRAQQLDVPADLLPCKGRFDFATVRALREAMIQNPAAIVHVHDYKSALYAWWARGTRKRSIVATAHGHFATSTKLRAYEHLETWLMRRFNHVCIVSESMRPLLVKAGVGEARIDLIENGIDTERFRPDAAAWSRQSLDIPPDAVVFGAAMRLSEQKNPLGLIDAFAQVVATLPNALLAIAGDGPLRAALLARAAQRGVSERLRLLGARYDLQHFYPLLNVFVLPSWYEGLPLALLEAMATARPVVATCVGQVPSVLNDLPVELVEPGDAPALAAAMLRSARDARCAGLRERVLERYSVARMARSYAQIYRSLGVRYGRAAA